MGALRDAINAKATPNQRAAFAAEDWCRVNPDWKRLCDIQDPAYRVLLDWNEITEDEREMWTKAHGSESDARLAWEHFGRVGRYRIPTGFIMDDGTFLYPDQWRQLDLRDRGFMQVFKIMEATDGQS